MKIAIICVLFNTPSGEILRLISELNDKSISFSFYSIDNTKNNKGYARGVNEGIKNAIKEGYELFMIINDDISFKKISTHLIKKGIEKYDVLGGEMIQNKLKYYGGELDQIRMSAGLSLTKPQDNFKQVDYVTGSLIVTKKSVIDAIGMFDESYFMYYEDVDFCLRAKKAGYRVGINKEIVYEHFEDKFKNPFKDYYLAKNRLKFFIKFASIKQWIYEIIRIPLTLIECLPITINYLLWKRRH